MSPPFASSEWPPYIGSRFSKARQRRALPRRPLARDVIHDEANQRLIGDGVVLRLGDAVEVRLREAEIVTGGLVFELISGGSKPDGKTQRPARQISRGKGRRGKARR